MNALLLRFLNIIISKGLPTNEMWRKIRAFRVEQLKQYSNSNFKSVYCFTNEELISIVETFRNFVGVQNISDEVNSKISKDTLNEGAEMFQSLYSCPPFFVRLYLKAIYGNKTSTTMAMLASKVVKKASNDFREKAIRIFEKIASVFGFQYISQYHKENLNFERNITNVKGEHWHCIMYLMIF